MSQQSHSRKVTGSLKRKPSVFERLGSKSTAKSKIVTQENWDDGASTVGKVSKVSYNQAVLKKAMKKSSHSKKSKDKHRRSHNVAEKTQGHSETAAWDSLDLGDLEGADEKFLQKRRLQLQRELRLQLKKESNVGSKKPKKPEKKPTRALSSSSASSSDSSSSSSSSSSSYQSKKHTARKRKGSPSSGSDETIHEKKRKIPKPPPKVKVDVKKKAVSPRKIEVPRKQTSGKKSVSPEWDRRPSPIKKKSPARSKPRPPSPKHKPREPSPRRPVKPKERRPSPPPRPPARPRSPDRRHRHSPRPRHGKGGVGLEKGGKILPVKSSAYVKEMKDSLRRKSPDRFREEKEKEKERLKEKKRREQKAREAERREREREVERTKREAERQKEREDALQRCRERQRERERLDRLDRDKRVKEFDRKEGDPRKGEAKSDLPSLLDIKTEAPPRDQGRRGWDERRPRRSDENFDFRRIQRDDMEPVDDRRGRKVHDYLRDTATWDGKDEFREPPPSGDWGRDWKLRPYEPKWSGDGGREGGWREHYPPRRPADWHAEPPPLEEPRLDDRPPPSGEHSRRPVESVVADQPTADVAPVDGTADLEEVLSDISDDPDDILNQVDETPVEPMEATPSQLIPVSLSQPSAEFFFDSRRPLLECLGDRGLDFEEISDEELEEEAKMSKGIMDVLGADWASLISKAPVKTPKRETTSSARRRWRADCIIARIGISRRLAGDEFVDKYMARIRSQGLEADSINSVKAENNADEPTQMAITEIKNDPGQDTKAEIGANNTDSSLVVKQEAVEWVEEKNMDHEGEKKEQGLKNEEFNFLHHVPAVHALLAELSESSPVSRILNRKFKSALSARTDLAIRRVVCGLSPKEPLQLAPCDDALIETSLSLFKSAAA